MAFKWVTSAEIAEGEALRKEVAELRELKGYYDALNEENQLFRGLYISGNMVEFAPWGMSKVKEAYETNGAIYGIVNRISSAVAELLPYVELQNEKNEVVGGMPLDVLMHPNDRESGKKFVAGWANERLIYGNAFVYANKAIGSRRGMVNDIYRVPAYKTSIGTDGHIQPIRGIYIVGYNVDRLINISEVMHSFTYNPDATSFYGLSPLAVAAEYVQLLQKGLKRSNTAMENGAVNTIITPARDSSGLVVPQAATELERELNRSDFVNKTKVLRQAIEAHQFGSTPVQLGILDSSKDCITALCFVYNIPVDLYYGQSKYENAREAKKALYEFAAIPLMNELLEDWTTFLLRDKVTEKLMKGLHFAINTDRIDVLKSSPTEIQTNLNLMGASLNERREAYGYDRIEEGYADKPMIPMGYQFGDMDAITDIDENA